MFKSFAALLGGFLMSWLLSKPYSFCLHEPLCLIENGAILDFRIFGWLSAISLVFGFLSFFLYLGDTSNEYEGNLGYDDYSLRELAGELTRQELRDQKNAERWNYNQNMCVMSWWAGSNTYIDYDGDRRSTGYFVHDLYDNVFIPEHQLV